MYMYVCVCVYIYIERERYSLYGALTINSPTMISAKPFNFRKTLELGGEVQGLFNAIHVYFFERIVGVKV